MAASEQIIQVLDALCEKFGLAIDWTSENVVPYISVLFEKLVKYEIWSSVAWLAFAVIGLAVSIVLAVVTIKKFGKLEGLEVPTSIASIFISIAAIAGIVAQIMDIIQCVTFPEMFVFEYVQALISSGS